MLDLAKHHPSKIYFTGCDATKAASLIDSVKDFVPSADLTFIECDLGSLRSVKAAVQQFSSCSRLDILMCNATIVAPPAGLTRDGYEVQFGTNHLGHAFLIKLLLPTLLYTTTLRDADVRIVIRTSLKFRFYGHPKGIVFEDLRTVQNMYFAGPWYRYSQSKLANILYAAELARRYPAITSVSVIPGPLAEEYGPMTYFPFTLLDYVAKFLGFDGTPGLVPNSPLWAAVCRKEDGVLVNGELHGPAGFSSLLHNPKSKSEELAAQLWEWTQDELHGY